MGDCANEAVSSPSTTFSESRIFKSVSLSFNIMGELNVIIGWEHYCKYDNGKSIQVNIYHSNLAADSANKLLSWNKISSVKILVTKISITKLQLNLIKFQVYSMIVIFSFRWVISLTLSLSAFGQTFIWCISTYVHMQI